MNRTVTFWLLLALAPAAVAKDPPHPPPPHGPPPHGPPPHGPPPPYGPPPPGAPFPPPPGGPHPPGRPPLPPSVIDDARAREPAILAWAEAHDPESHERLLELQTGDPRAYLGQLVRVARMMDRSARDPDVVARHLRMQEIEEQLREGASDWQALDEATRAERRAELVALTAELFEIRQEERRAHVAELQERIRSLREEIERREADRSAIVEEYVDELVSGVDP